MDSATNRESITILPLYFASVHDAAVQSRGDAASWNVRPGVASLRASRRVQAAWPVAPSTLQLPGFVGIWLSS